MMFINFYIVEPKYCFILMYTRGLTAVIKRICYVMDNSRRQTVHTRRASVHQAAKLVAARLRVARVTAGLAESNGTVPPGL